MLGVRLLCEPSYSQDFHFQGNTGFDISISGFRARRAYPQNNDVVASRSYLGSALNNVAVCFLVSDYVIGRK